MTETLAANSVMPAVSVVIPTYNSGKHLLACLDSLDKQTFRDFEVIVVDNHSSDRTAEIARERSIFIQAKSSTTEARLAGCRRCKGKYVLNLDSDQTLTPTALARAVTQNKKIVVLGETGEGRGLVAILNRAEKASAHEAWAEHSVPATGLVIPRFFERDLLLTALEAIPPRIRSIKPTLFAEDSLIFFEASKHTCELGFVPDALLHAEEESLPRYLRKWYNYGRSARAFRGTDYDNLVSGRIRSRLSETTTPQIAVSSLLRGIPFLIGKVTG
jgi:glycosyltransferase involved in cell wall biosynthesis